MIEHDANANPGRLNEEFREAVHPPTKLERRKSPPPFSLRLSIQERAYLQEQAGAQPLGAYIRRRLLGERAEPRLELRRPTADQQKIAAVLAELGRSHLSQNLNQIAKAANTGVLSVSPGLLAELQEACADIRRLRETLMSALGLKTESGR